MEKIITGFHSIEEKVRAGSNQPNLKIYYSKAGPRIKKILEEAKKTGIRVFQVVDSQLDDLVKNLDQTLQDHRGIVMKIENTSPSQSNLIDFDSWVKESANKEKLTVVILDKVTDPHNVGAILRSCDQFGASLVIIPEHNSANDITENEVIGRTSAGANAWVPVTIVNNLVRCVESLKKAGFWIYGADAGGESCCKVDFSKKSVIIMGSEGNGISKLLEEECDTIVSIPTCGKIDSLNVSVAAGVLLYELFRR
ncbi:MAG: 23S rRNA (guanosine(2251)-2'-O)-methyltransferase RlmB [Treponema sp.]|nr:23S rRNA (guanosine(2251)-2'-O)-methyltransferase RlmB [Treponema sp.]